MTKQVSEASQRCREDKSHSRTFFDQRQAPGEAASDRCTAIKQEAHLQKLFDALTDFGEGDERLAAPAAQDALSRMRGLQQALSFAMYCGLSSALHCKTTVQKLRVRRRAGCWPITSSFSC